MAKLGAKGGKVSSEAKHYAARINGAKGGRPPKPKTREITQAQLKAIQRTNKALPGGDKVPVYLT